MGHASEQYLVLGNNRGEQRRIAYLSTPVQNAEEPGLVWFSRLNSNMLSTKASALTAWAAQTNRSMLRFDFSGHGASDGEFSDGTIGQWLDESLAILREVAEGPQILVGSSMGAWIVLLILRAIANEEPVARTLCPVQGAVLIAPAWDMTEELMWKDFSKAARAAIETNGYFERPSRYGDGPYIISRDLIEEGRNHLIGGKRFAPPCPVRIIHGIDDPDVPWRHAKRLTHILLGKNIMLNLIQDGDHRLSRPKDIDRILSIIEDLYKDLRDGHYA